MLRAAGVQWDLRKADPYEVYDRLEFDVPIGAVGDTFDRYLVRIQEMRESVKIVQQCVMEIPEGPAKANVPFYVRPPEGDAYAAVEGRYFAEGGDGGVDLAEAVIGAIGGKDPEISYLYRAEASIEEKVMTLATKVYGADGVQWSRTARRRLQTFQDLGWGELPVCMAKTHLSISAHPKMLGRPQGHTFPITDIRVAAGAGFVYPLAGQIMTLPGLPKSPNALKIDVDQKGNVIGLV